MTTSSVDCTHARTLDAALDSRRSPSPGRGARHDWVVGGMTDPDPDRYIEPTLGYPIRQGDGSVILAAGGPHAALVFTVVTPLARLRLRPRRVGCPGWRRVRR